MFSQVYMHVDIAVYEYLVTFDSATKYKFLFFWYNWSLGYLIVVFS